MLKKRRTGCLVPLGIYVGLIVIGFFLTRPPLVTGDFSNVASRRFSIATVEQVDGQHQYGRQTLESVLERNPASPSFGFLLPEEGVVIDTGDIHRANVIEDHGDWQLIEFFYSNSHTSRSTYRAYADRIEPVSYQMTSSIGDVVMVVVLAVPAYLLALTITFIRNRKGRKTGSESDNGN